MIKTVAAIIMKSLTPILAKQHKTDGVHAWCKLESKGFWLWGLNPFMSVAKASFIPFHCN